jgi:hypothetical protein
MEPVVVWGRVEETRGAYDFWKVDPKVLRLRRLGLEPTVSLLPLSPWGTREAWAASAGSDLGKGDLPDGENLVAWQEFCAALVERYDLDGVDDLADLDAPVLQWHLVQEWPTFFLGAGRGDPDPVGAAARYVLLLEATTEAVKGANPAARVMLAGLAARLVRIFAFADGFIADERAGIFDGEAYSAAELRSAEGFRLQRDAFRALLQDGAPFADVVDVHLYEEIVDFAPGKLAWVRAVLAEAGFERAVVNTEGGAPFLVPDDGDYEHGDPAFGTYDEAQGARDQVKLAVLGLANGMERVENGLTCADPETSPWDGPWLVMGLLESDGTPRKAFWAYRHMTRSLQGFTAAATLRETGSGERAYAFETERGRIVVAWAAAPEAVIDLGDAFEEAELELQVSPQTDGPVPVVAVPSGAVPLSPTPVFVAAPCVLPLLDGG